MPENSPTAPINPLDTYKMSRVVGSLATLGIKSYEDLKPDQMGDPQTRQEKLNRLVFGDIDLKYSKALDNVIEASQKKKPKGIKERILGIVLSKTSLDEKVMQAAIKITVRGESSDVSEKLFDTLNTFVDELPQALEKWMQDGTAPPEMSEDLKMAIEGVQKGDMLLRTKILVDTARSYLDQYKIDLRSQKSFIEAMIQHNIPELRDIGPNSLSFKTLEALQNYGLAEYLPVHMFLDYGYTAASNYGEAYSRNVVEEWGGKPKQDEVSSIPYQERLRAWQQVRIDYSGVRDTVIRDLSAYDQHRKDEGLLERSFDINWLRQNFYNIRKEIEGMLNHPATRRLFEYAKHPKVESYDWGKFRGEPRFEESAQAMQTVFDFAEKYNTPEADDLLQNVMFKYRDMMMGLYNIKDASEHR